MTKQIDDFLNIPHEEELKEEDNALIEQQPTEVAPVEHKSTAVSVFVKEDEHSTEVEEVRKRALNLQDEIAEVARNVAPDRSARMFEVSGQHLKIALDASNAKIKAQLDAAKLKIDAARLKIDDEMIDGLNSGKEVVADRNELIRKLLGEEESNVVDVDVDEE